MEAPADLERAVLQAASGSIAVPELELALSSGGSGGMVTTVGKLISGVRGCARGRQGARWPAGLSAGTAAQRAWVRWPGRCASLKFFILPIPSVHRLLQLAQQLGSNPALVPGGGGAEGAEAEAAEWADFLSSLKAFAALEKPWTLEVTDPLSASHVAPRAGAAAGAADPQLEVAPYDRTPEDNAAFGLTGARGEAAPIA